MILVGVFSMRGKAWINPAGRGLAVGDVFSVGLMRCEHLCRVFLLGVLLQLVLTEDGFGVGGLKAVSASFVSCYAFAWPKIAFLLFLSFAAVFNINTNFDF